MSNVFKIAFLLFLVSCDPRPQPYSCKVITITANQSTKVLRTYGPSFFGTDCPKGTPEEILITAEGYNVYMYFQANSNPKVFVGIEGESLNFHFKKDDWRENSSRSAYDRATHWKDLAGLIGDSLEALVPSISGKIDIYVNPKLKLNSDREVKFSVSDSSGKINVHKYPFTITECKCKSYDAV